MNLFIYPINYKSKNLTCKSDICYASGKLNIDVKYAGNPLCFAIPSMEIDILPHTDKKTCYFLFNNLNVSSQLSVLLKAVSDVDQHILNCLSKAMNKSHEDTSKKYKGAL